MDSIGGLKPFSFASSMKPQASSAPEKNLNNNITDGFSAASSSSALMNKSSVMQFIAGSDKVNETSSVASDNLKASADFNFPLNGINSKEFFYLGI